MTDGTLYLASTSPRRADLIGELGRPVSIVDPELDDAAEERLTLLTLARGLDPAVAVQRVAIAKLLAGLTRAAPSPGELCVAADTTVAHGGAMLGKAPTRAAARAMLLGLAGTRHAVHTGVAVLDGSGRLKTGLATSHVTFRAFGPETVDAYLATEVWRGKAGAYGVQDDEAQPLIEAVEGSRSNVKGLPLELLGGLLDL